MPKKFDTDLDLDNVARVGNALDALLPQDYVTLAFLQAFSIEYNAEDVGETSNTSQTIDATKVTLITPALISGNYILEWSFKVKANGSNRRARVNIKDDVTEVLNHIEHLADAAEYTFVTGRKKFTGISGIKTFTLNFRADTANTTITLSEALVTIRKVV